MDTRTAVAEARWLMERFGAENTVVELQHHQLPGDTTLVTGLLGIASHLGLMAVATNDVQYARQDQAPLHDVLTAIRHRTTLDAAGLRLRANSEYYLKSGGRLRPLFSIAPEAITNTRRVAERCDLQVQYGLQDLPAFPTASGCDAIGMLTQLCTHALCQRYPDTPERIHRQLRYELQIIDQAGLSNYLLIVWDIVRFANMRGIRCQGRGSAANSLVAYLLGISVIDPIAHNLVFERFLSAERPALPDIDIDIQADRREEVIL
jgi:DNA polymerase III alpha subunit